jgi:hypothetical protein
MVFGLDLPSIVLAILLGMAGWILYKTQSRDDFDFAEMMRDDTTSEAYPKGKPSIYRICAMFAFAVHSWILVHDTIVKGLEHNEILYYAMTWSGSLILAKGIDAAKDGWGK